MKLALIIDDYLPYSTRIAAKMFHDLAVYLVKEGHDVTIITPKNDQTQSLAFDEIDGVKIWRFKSGKVKNVSKVKRAINESLLSFRAWWAIRKTVNKNSFDGVIYYSPSIFFGGIVRWLCQRCQCHSYLVLRDLFPLWAIDAGIISERSLITSYFRFFERLSYKQAKMIGLMSDSNIKVFKNDGNSYPTELLRNWYSLAQAHQYPIGHVPFRQRLHLQNKVIFLYGGNIGRAQDMANLMRLTKAMAKHEQAHFLYVGQGDEVDLIKSLATNWNLTNFTYLPSINQTEFKLLLSEVDIGLFSLSADHTSHNVPGKLLGYMAQQIPILGSVNKGNDLMELVNHNNAGIIRVNGDDSSLYQAAKMLLEEPQLREMLGKGAYKLLQQKFSVATAARTILHHLYPSKKTILDREYTKKTR
ncbi:glycosyltransferase family 4 protein [Escherichia coli]|uniref:glycosyltransferase family 4 protein n=1 Tax=Escherichia coli TaxID=562 RepID=UPI000BDEFE48|nr:glycosyltransferase family 4 protein [Escherichia coli]EFN1826201.1 glycosyltransferase family 4 protein [Escherichia coli]EGE4615253.1 glycosyltransferase family 4 protein [Escherichia coli]EHY6431057.1 glycosyltransferase family 4 protein [Escherichia coli]MBI9296097.1 glycosyltransferase family 4 protein [Escherichia coli]PCS94443.1 glycosyltransferase WbuB [Escherichia coli]